MYKKWLLVIMALFSPVLSFAESVDLKTGQQVESSISENTDKDKIVSEIMEISGAKIQMENFSNYVQSTLTQFETEIPPVLFEIVSKAIIESYRSGIMYQVIAGNLKVNFDANHYTALLNWLRTPLSRKMSRLDELSSTQGAMQEMINFAAEIQTNPLPKERIALMQGLEEVVGGTDFNIEMKAVEISQMFNAIEIVMARVQSEKGQNWGEDFKSNLTPEDKRLMKEGVLNSYLYVYRSVSDEELKEYIDFWNSDEGRWSTKTFKQATLDAMAKVGSDIQNKLSKELPELLI